MTKKLLLPFQHGLDVRAIEQAVRLAKGSDATLAPFSLIPIAERYGKKDSRLDLVQQSKDFLEVTRHKARAYAVPVEPYERYTKDCAQSICMLVYEMQCDGIVLFISYKGGLLLPADIISKLVDEAKCKLYIIRLPSDDRLTLSQKLRMSLLRWMPGKRTFCTQ